jgi:vacuolar-type H+-ATPase subunit C/Vma6
MRKIDNSGYPIEYLAARIRVRRGWLITDWRPFLADRDPLEAISAARFGGRPVDRTAEGVWKSLLREFAWVYCQMDDRTKKVFFPFFLHFELRTLVLCLRNKVAGNTDRINELLSFSLLGENLKNILAGAQDASLAVAALETAFVLLSPAFRGLKETYGKKGIQGLEQALNDASLEYAAGERFNPVIEKFFRYLTDLRNLMILYKHSRWELAGTPVFLKGGTIGKARFGEVLAGKEPGGIAALLRGLPCMEGELGRSGSPEVAILRAMTRYFRRESREPSGFGMVLEYLWCSYMEAVNIGILSRCGSIGREAVEAELIS